MLYSNLEYAKMEYSPTENIVEPASYSQAFLERNKMEIRQHYKKAWIRYRPCFRAARFGHVLRSCFRRRLCVGQVFAGLGDMVMYSHLPRLLKDRLPWCRILVYDSEIARIVFANNPYVDGFTLDKRLLWNKKGSGTDYGSGHLTQMKARFWGIKDCLPRGELHISAAEQHRALKPLNKPIATLQAYGRTIVSPINDDLWAAVVEEVRQTHLVIQLKSPQERTLEGVDATISGVRDCIIQQSVADLHIGIDSGFTHTAAALGLPTVVILDRLAIGRGLVKDGVHQLLLPQLGGRSLDFLYPQHSYLCAGPGTARAPSLTRHTLRLAMEGKIYPFRKQEVWNWS